MITTPRTRRKSRLNSVTQAVMPFMRALSQIALIYCVIVAARKTFYPNLPSHSPEYTSMAIGTGAIAWVLLKAAEWQKATG